MGTAPPRWAVPGFPHEPVDEPSLNVVPDAHLTRVRRGDLRTVATPTRWLRGAVHDADGRLVVASQKIGGLGGNQAAMADPARAVAGPGVRRLGGTWLYGGHWIQHFGHFVTETVTTLWPDASDLGPVGAGRDTIEGVVFHSYMSRWRGVEPWQTELVALSGWGGLPVEVVEAEPLRVERLLVPSRSVVVNGWAHPGALRVWRRMAVAAGGPAPGGPSRVYVSRTDFNAARRAADRPVRSSAARDVALDAVFAGAGFTVVAPETLAVVDQVRLAAGASVMAGGAGTALHLTAFAPAGTRVVELGDTRSPTWQVPQQQVVDTLCEHPTAFVPADVEPEQVRGVLADLGL